MTTIFFFRVPAGMEAFKPKHIEIIFKHKKDIEIDSI